MKASQVSTCLLEVDAIVQQLRTQLTTKENTIRVQEERIVSLQRELAQAEERLTASLQAMLDEPKGEGPYEG